MDRTAPAFVWSGEDQMCRAVACAKAADGVGQQIDAFDRVDPAEEQHERLVGSDAQPRPHPGAAFSVHVDVDGESIWAFIRCDETSPVPAARGGRFGLDCMTPDGKLKPHDTIYKFDPKGNVVKSFGAGMFIWPHGLHIDREGNIWATDVAPRTFGTALVTGGDYFKNLTLQACDTSVSAPISIEAES